MIKHLFLGSIGVIADTSDIQRRAYNSALKEAGLSWEWDESTYRRLLTMNGGKQRLRLLADATSTEMSDDTVDDIHESKTRKACNEVRALKNPLRPGVAELIKWCQENDITVSLVTATYPPNVEAISEAAGDDLPLESFGVVVTRDKIERGKPAPDAYTFALQAVGAETDEVLCIEDSASSTLAAVGAGLRTVTIPGSLTAGQIAVGAEMVLESLAGPDGYINPELLDLLKK